MEAHRSQVLHWMGREKIRTSVQVAAFFKASFAAQRLAAVNPSTEISPKELLLGRRICEGMLAECLSCGPTCKLEPCEEVGVAQAYFGT
mmetsp:Transcript_69324/g.122742  ORF Transcript_69324/g.122742 Transcript_69324/m.122742 type:complete len:89 (-) Transcript_69324:19-285(-)